MIRFFSKPHGFFELSGDHCKSFPVFASLFHSSRATESKLSTVLREIEQLHSVKLMSEEDEAEDGEQTRRSFSTPPSVEISHPWPEWVNLMEVLLKKGYLSGDGREIGLKDSNRIRTACLSFARDRFDLVRYFSRKDIHVVAGVGCPSLDRKVVNSGKRLRAHVGIEEGKVCSFCSLRGNCERAYIKASENEGGRTVDVMRILLTYGMDHLIDSVENKQCQSRSVKESVRRLIIQMVEFSGKELDSSNLNSKPKKVLSNLERSEVKVPMKQGDWICPKCNFLNFAKNIKCLKCEGLFQERIQKLVKGQEHLPLKMGDWLCDKCNFLNFAKNTKCLLCKEKPSNRQLNPGEWECPSCNYVNFKRNNLCLKCNWKRPKASNFEANTVMWPQREQHHFEHSRVNFVRNAEDDSRGFRETDIWSNGEEDDEDDLSGLQKPSYLDDFPILGGNSSVSRDPNERERWKKLMHERSKDLPKYRRMEGNVKQVSKKLEPRSQLGKKASETSLLQSVKNWALRLAVRQEITPETSRVYLPHDKDWPSWHAYSYHVLFSEYL
ncbi:hypothetical protein H6P81_015187 [Aristolochia fimbriata]|uniref:RanBP2-type domain-containing protein n=1 Tax=Aristolochia fimbriata TaxID=158543 RepID=A0AAV7E8K8_ARIFI|nr:hypothetical protein H6P81_015187 [Aristolochia fimbriata]